MTPSQPEWTWLDASQSVTLTELSHSCGLSESELNELIDYSALVPLGNITQDQPERAFSAQCVMPLRTASRMRVDFDLDLFTVAIVLGNLNRIDVLERQVQSLTARLPGGAEHITG